MASQLRTLITDRLSIFEVGGLHGYNVAALSYAPLVVANGLAVFFSSSTALAIFLLLCAVTAALGAAFLTRRQGAPLPFAVAVGVLYALGPIFVNKLGSGQINAWSAYAALPWAFICIQGFRDRFDPLRVACLGLCSIAIAAQIHVFAVFFFLTAALAAATWRISPFVQTVGGLCIGAVSQIFGVAEVLYAVHSNTIDQYAARIPWEVGQSSGVLDAVGLTGYYAHYFQTLMGGAYPWIHWLQVALGVAAFWGLLQAKTRTTRTMFIAGLLIVLAVSSFHTPLKPLAAAVFERYSWLSLFRELYNLNELLAVIYCVGLGFAFSNRYVRAFAIALIGVLLIAYIVPSYARILHITNFGAHLNAAAYIAQRPGDAAVWPLPNGRFLVEGSGDGGYDPFAGRLGSHSVLEQYFATGAIAAVESRSTTGAMPLLRAMGVGYIWCRSGLSWKPPQWSGKIAALQPPCAGLRNARAVSSDRVSEVPASPAWRLATRIAVTPDVWSRGIDELRRGDFVFARDAAVFGVDEGAGTLADVRAAVDPSQGPIPAELGDRSNALFSDIAGPARVVSPNFYRNSDTARPAFRIIAAKRLRKGTILYSSSTYSVAVCDNVVACVTREDPFAVVGVALKSPVMRARPVDLGGAVVLINNAGYRPAWQATVHGTPLPHFRVDGFANGWLVPRQYLNQVTFSDRSAAVLRVLRALSICAWAAVAVLLLLPAVQRLTAVRVLRFRERL